MAEDGGLYYSEGNDASAAFKAHVKSVKNSTATDANSKASEFLGFYASAAFNTKFYAVKISKIF